jgi:hypothetical protein
MEVSWSALCGLARISLMKLSSRVLLIFKLIPAQGTMVQSWRSLHFMNFAVGSKVFPFWTK